MKVNRFIELFKYIANQDEKLTINEVLDLMYAIDCCAYAHLGYSLTDTVWTKTKLGPCPLGMNATGVMQLVGWEPENAL